MRILITGGAGFVGGALARAFLQADEKHSVVLLDNLRRRGSEWNLSKLLTEGAQFVHGDVRNQADLDSLEGSFDILVEASAEPSVHAGLGSSPRYVLDTNLGGALNCLEFARQRCGGLIFLSTSRIYSLAPLRALPLLEGSSRLQFDARADIISGASTAGIAEHFACNGPRSYYGASKLGAELLCQEYAAHAALPVVINRCGVIAGPGQFGKTDQGVFTLWVARHRSGRPLKYTGFGGKGLQVRDLLHPDDLSRLIQMQISNWPKVGGQIFNVGGGQAGSVSLLEYTRICRDITGNETVVEEDPTTSPVDIPWYISDHGCISSLLGWKPERTPREIVQDIDKWLRVNEQALASFIV
jgi:CDP-paratose 2-epimerase